MQMRVEAAIHIINTLKSVNDRSLSDWQGVIGEEITAQREQRAEKEEELRELLALYSTQLARAKVHGVDPNIRLELDSIRRDLQAMASLMGVPVRRKLPSRMATETLCSKCGASIKYRQRMKKGGYKKIACKACGTELVSQTDGVTFSISPLEQVPETVACPSCSNSMHVDVPNMMYEYADGTCGTCGANLRVIRVQGGVKVKTIGKPPDQPVLGAAGSAEKAPQQEITDALLDEVKAKLPKQPWPVNTTEQLAAQMEIPLSLARSAVRRLITRGDFLAQVDGVLFARIGSAQLSPVQKKAEIPLPDGSDAPNRNGVESQLGSSQTVE